MKKLEFLCSITVAAAVLASIVSCEETGNVENGTIVMDAAAASLPENALLTGNTLMISAEGGSVNIPLKCSVSGIEPVYEVSSEQPWFTASVQNSILTLDVNSSDSKAPREGIVTISGSCPDAVITPVELEIKQSEKNIPKGKLFIDNNAATLSTGTSIDEKGNILFPYYGGCVKVPLKNTLENQNIEIAYSVSNNSADWVDVNVKEGNLVISACPSANSSGDITVTIIEAKGASEEILLTPLSLSVKREAFKSSVEMVLVNGGTFIYGKGKNLSTADNNTVTDYTASHAHEVTLSAYYISVTEVTQKLYKEVMSGDNPSATKYQGEDKPVVGVKWQKAVEFCNELSKKDGLEPAYEKGEIIEVNDGWTITKFQDYVIKPGADGYRLPTAAEWEFAAQGGNTGVQTPKVFAGSDSYDDVAWLKDNSKVGNNPDLKNVAQKKPNSIGLYDMTGNAQEWCHDWTYKYGVDRTVAETDPLGPVFTEDRTMKKSNYNMKVGRGGSIQSGLSDAYTVYERGIDPLYYCDLNGIRLVRSVKK